MTKEELIRNLKYTMEKHKNDKVDTFGTNISLMCKDILDYLEQPTTKDCLAVGDCVSREQAIKTISTDIQLNLEGRSGLLKYSDEIKDILKTLLDSQEKKLKALPPVTPTHGTCKDCKHLKVWRSGRRKGIYCGLHTEADFCFEVEKDFYCAYFEKKDTCKDCRAWRPRGGENGFCARSPHGCKADESCENFEKRGAENG